MRRFFIGLAGVLAGLLLLLAGIGYHNSRDRHPGYSLDLDLRPPPQAGMLKAGFAAVKITPFLPDRWRDQNHNSAYDPDEGDRYTDGNGNGRFDAFWMAGFGQKRAASGVHDDLWARAMVLDDGRTRLAFVAVDLLGFMHKNVLNVRKALPAAAGIDYAVISSTHTHEAPDFIGMWGGSFLKSGVDPAYEQFVEQQVVRAILEAAGKCRPARLRFAQDLTGADTLVADTRKPIVKDPGLYVMQALDAERDSTLGMLVVWGNHPETLWSKNTLLTSDFPHYVRHYLENGIQQADTALLKGLGGTVVYATGAIGGLMTTSPKVTVHDPVSGECYTEPTFEKADAQGKQLALLIGRALERDTALAPQTGIRLRARTVELPLTNPLFRLGVAAGVLDAGYSRWGYFRTEVAAIRIADATFLCVPGEIYPEIVNGGIRNPADADFRMRPYETPPLRSLMRGRYKFVIGLANDELGYIIPKSEWDTEKPYGYGADSRPYGEINSVGPDTAPVLYRAMTDLLHDF
ncbi:neutral/alkaline non-lysosomal ceramidase N-terminal domain-containing protein [Larkinella soli]|uniref:neutral/alkaline non-lysosomal ceramidase N-terminal domain-containing protein n=1 Tax=Larkinella soli TaxID=1770527 RepID=UPI000FFC32BA|nr:neutral/alkaline non-lysosomal ceramidase N-terminal domain-containing protein [Larkinella soli]